MFLHYHLSRTYLFQSTYLYKVRHLNLIKVRLCSCFNPRTYIRYDFCCFAPSNSQQRFQSTYLYKVRPSGGTDKCSTPLFQSTYLYKVRPCRHVRLLFLFSFNPRTYIRYDPLLTMLLKCLDWFQSTYLYKVRH